MIACVQLCMAQSDTKACTHLLSIGVLWSHLQALTASAMELYASVNVSGDALFAFVMCCLRSCVSQTTMLDFIGVRQLGLKTP